MPSEFRYRDNLELPWVRRARKAARTVLRFDPAPEDHVVEMLESMYEDADPIAEAYLEDAAFDTAGPGVARGFLDRALADGIDAVRDAPASLRTLLADIETEPDWLDWDELERGAKAFRRYGTSVFFFAGAITLEGYRESSVAKPLALTGAYAGASTRKRFLETASFWIDVSEPGGMRLGAPGFQTALRVRLMHVYVRKRLLAHPEWDREAWGVPISQGDALMTLMGGSFLPGLGLQTMGYLTSPAEIRAMMHFWRYVGHVLGVRPRWYPQTLREAAQLTFVSFVKAAHTSGDDGVHLCRSFVNAFAPDPDAPLPERVVGHLEHQLVLGYTRLFVPPWSYGEVGLPPARTAVLHPLAWVAPTFAAETLRHTVPGLDRVADRVARKARRKWLARHLGEDRAHYRPVESFTR